MGLGFEPRTTHEARFFGNAQKLTFILKRVKVIRFSTGDATHQSRPIMIDIQFVSSFFILTLTVINYMFNL